MLERRGFDPSIQHAQGAPTRVLYLRSTLLDEVAANETSLLYLEEEVAVEPGKIDPIELSAMLKDTYLTMDEIDQASDEELHRIEQKRWARMREITARLDQIEGVPYTPLEELPDLS